MFSSTTVTSQFGGHNAANVARPSGGFSARFPGKILFSAQRKLQKLSGNRGLMSNSRTRRCTGGAVLVAASAGNTFTARVFPPETSDAEGICHSGRRWAHPRYRPPLRALKYYAIRDGSASRVGKAPSAWGLPAGIIVPTFLQRSPPSHFATAACGGLKPAPDCRLRGAHNHHLVQLRTVILGRRS